MIHYVMSQSLTNISVLSHLYYHNTTEPGSRYDSPVFTIRCQLLIYNIRYASWCCLHSDTSEFRCPSASTIRWSGSTMQCHDCWQVLAAPTSLLYHDTSARGSQYDGPGLTIRCQVRWYLIAAPPCAIIFIAIPVSPDWTAQLIARSVE